MSISPLSRVVPHVKLGLVTAGLAAISGFTFQPIAAQSLRVDKVWEIGGLNGPPESIWMRIEDATVLGDRIYAVDIALPAVRAFTIDGRYVGDLGREGQGPGEFVRPVSAVVVRDSLWIFDIVQDRFAIFDAFGNHGRTSPIHSIAGRDLERVWPGRHGWNVGVTGLIGRSTPGRSISVHRALSWSAETVDTIAEFDGKPYWRRYRTRDSLYLNTVLSLGPDGGIWVLGDSLIVQVDGTSSVAKTLRIDPAGLYLGRTRSLPGRPHPLSEAETDLAIAHYYWFFGLDPDSTNIVEVVPPDTLPAWSKILGDGDGAIWLRRGGPEMIDPEVGERWMRWSLEDGSLDWVELPPGVEALRFRSGYMVGKRRGEFEVEWLVLYRVHGW